MYYIILLNKCVPQKTSAYLRVSVFLVRDNRFTDCDLFVLFFFMSVNICMFSAKQNMFSHNDKFYDWIIS
jgi:hypothetical protein